MSTTILCVDDERMVLLALREQLQRHLGDDAIIETADDGISGLEVLSQSLEDGETIPLVITDHIMPGLQGDEVVARVKALSPETLTVMLTGQATAEAVGSALNSGGLYRFMAKPWNQDDLAMTVTGALRSFRRQRELEAQRATLREVHEAALDLTANLAAADRYERLLTHVVQIVGAEKAALAQRQEGGWMVLAASGVESHGGGPPSPELVARWNEELAAGVPVRRSANAEGQEIWKVQGWASGLSVPFRVGDRPPGLLLLASPQAGRFQEVEDDRLYAAASLVGASLHTAELIDALEVGCVRRQRVAQELVRQANTLLAGVLVGQSQAVQTLRREITRVADESPRRRILIQGRVGSGIEAVARAIHAESKRFDRPFILVNCAMAHGGEGADSAAELAAKVELAQGATLFLQGIEHLGAGAFQELRRLFAGPESKDVDIRLIASVIAGQGGSLAPPPRDLDWYSDERIQLPSLARRREDIPAMARLFLREHASRLGRGDLEFAASSMDRIQSYAWPGNERELMNVVERAALTTTGAVAEVEEALLALGHSVGNHTLIEKLGAGGMGEVWRAQHKHLHRPAAVKLVRSHEAGHVDPQAIARFRREAEATARLRSPHTVELYDFGVTEESGFFYVMELLEGMDLQDLVSTSGALPAERAIHLLGQTLRSLTEAHEAGLVHRDIKPANIFVSQLGADYDFIKVLDFGLVMGLGGTEDEASQQGQVTGTPLYLAPELASGEASDCRADLYALGAVAFWMLTGEQLFQQETITALLIAHASQSPDRPSNRLGSPLPDGLDDWVLALLAKDPNRRPATARDAHRHLMAIDVKTRWTQERAEQWWQSASRPLAGASDDTQVAPPAATQRG